MHEPSAPSFALGLTPDDVEEFRVILHEECGEELTNAEAWTRATAVLSLFHHFLERAATAASLDSNSRRSLDR